MKVKNAIEKLKSKLVGRPRPSVPKAGVLPSGRPYGKGGKVSRKKTS